MENILFSIQGFSKTFILAHFNNHIKSTSDLDMNALENKLTLWNEKSKHLSNGRKFAELVVFLSDLLAWDCEIEVTNNKPMSTTANFNLKNDSVDWKYGVD